MEKLLKSLNILENNQVSEVVGDALIANNILKENHQNGETTYS